jgi:transcriptional regulator with XRE-family HTH domain
METKTPRERVAAEVRACIARSGMKPTAIAQLTGIAQSTLSRKLSAQSSFDVDELHTIARALDVDVRSFFPRPIPVAVPA